MSESDVLKRLKTVLWVPQDSDVTPAERLIVYRDLLERAHDEIVALRDQVESRDFSFDKEFGDRDNVLAETAANARAEALEEAARYCESLRVSAFGEPQSDIGYNNQLCEHFAAGIRALKDERHE